MFELLLTSFPVLIQYFRLKRRGEAISVWNMKTPVFLWLVMAFALFFIVFYYHPKSYSGLLPFRTVSVVAQTAGPVTEVHVTNGQQVTEGDLLFRIEDSAQRAALQEAQANFDAIDAAESKARDSLKLAQASLAEAQANLDQKAQDLETAETLLAKRATTEQSVREQRTAATVAQAQVTAALAQVDVASADLFQSIPAQRKAAAATLHSARVALERTEVRAFGTGTVTQLAMSVGSPASTLILSPAMVIIPEHDPEQPRRVVAGFKQVARNALYVGMPAEVACDSNASMSFTNAIMPARVVDIQPAIATGQIVPGGRLLEPRAVPRRGSILVYLELLHPEHEGLLIDGNGCIVQTYQSDMHGIFGHIVAATGVVKAAGLRIKSWGVLLAGVGLAGGGGH